jgi:hypothetical protein
VPIMNRKYLIILAITLICLGSLAAQAQILPEDLQTTLISASSAKRTEIRDMIQEKYPDFSKNLFTHLNKSYPHFTTTFLRAEIRSLRELDSKTLANLYLSVSGDLEKTYSAPVKEFKSGMIATITEKYPDIPKEMKDYRGSSGFRQTFSTYMGEKYPHFKTDCLMVMREKHPALMLSIMRDGMSIVIQKDPRLIIDLKLEVEQIMEKQFPDLLKELAADPGRMKLGKFRAMVRENPKFAKALSEELDTKFHDRLMEARKAVVSGIIEKHSTEVLSACDDILVMIDEKYPEVAEKAVLMAIESREKFRHEFRDKHKEFFKEIASLKDKAFPYLLKDTVAAIDKCQPELRKKLKISLEKDLPGIQKNADAYLQKNYPGLKENIMKMAQ